MPDPEPHDRARRELAAWASSGAMAITGRPDGAPLGPPAGLVTALQAVAALLGERSAILGTRVEVDPLGLLAERAAISGLRRKGATSCGGATRLLEAGDGWLAVALPRPDDEELVPAWLGTDVLDGDDVWAIVAETVRRSPARVLAEAAGDLGLAVAALGEVAAPPSPPPPFASLPVRATMTGQQEPHRALDGIRVLDLSSLWAGPLCGSLLAQAGADVVKVESSHRPDGARRGPEVFFDLLNGGKRSVALDLLTDSGRSNLAALVGSADVVIEASRPRALAQLGIHAESTMAGAGPAVWLSITGHGRSNRPGRIAFGDDAAVAGGLVARDQSGPVFCADAVADPVTGLVGAAAVLAALSHGGRWLIDASMAAVAAALAGPTLPAGPGIEAAPPVARRSPRSAPALGEHTAMVLAELARP